MVLSTVVAALVVIAASVVVGHAVWRLCGLERSWVSAAVGLAALLTVAAAAVELPHGSLVAAVALGALLVAGVVVVARDVTARVLDAVVLVPVLLALACIPFAVTGYAGIIGVGVNNDFDPHLAAAWWLQTHVGVSKIVPSGYPLGAHALAAALGTGLRFGLVPAFMGITIAVPALTALAALPAFPRDRRVLRLLGAALVGVAYLAAAYLAQGAFKETLQALFVVAFAVALLETRGRVRAGIPLGLLVAGMVSVYSYFGVAWPALAVLLLVPFRRAPSLRTLGLAVAVLVVAVAPQLHRIWIFESSHYANELATGKGNLYGSLPPFESVGVWLTSDFRLHPDPYWLTLALIAIAVVALVAVVARDVARREVALPATLVGAFVVYVLSVLYKNPYNAAKGLTVASPILALTLLVPLLVLAVGERGRLRLAAAVVAALYFVPAAASSVLALRDARVGPNAHARELDQLRSVIGRAPVLFLVADDFGHWELRGARVATVRQLYATWVLPLRKEKPALPGALIDFDSATPEDLDQVRYVVTTSAAYASAPPVNFHAVARTRSYILWKRDGRTPPREIADAPNAPGGILDCSKVAARSGTAAVIPRPVVQGRWRGTTHNAGDVATTTLTLPAGTWDLSLQYVARQGLDLTTRGIRETLPANLERLGPYWPVGTVHVARRTTLHVRVRSRQVTWFGRLLGARGETRGLRTNLSLPLGTLAATRHGARPRLVPLRRGCGRYVDWYRAGAATS